MAVAEFQGSVWIKYHGARFGPWGVPAKGLVPSTVCAAVVVMGVFVVKARVTTQ